MKPNIPLIIGAAMIFIMVGMALADIGKLPEPNKEAYDWKLPVFLFGYLGGIFAMGYIAAKNDKD